MASNYEYDYRRLDNGAVIRYKMYKSAHGSSWYGPCSVCGRDADVIWFQARAERYATDKRDWDAGYTAPYGWAELGPSVAGHAECLRSVREGDRLSAAEAMPEGGAACG